MNMIYVSLKHGTKSRALRFSFISENVIQFGHKQQCISSLLKMVSPKSTQALGAKQVPTKGFKVGTVVGPAWHKNASTDFREIPSSYVVVLAQNHYGFRFIEQELQNANLIEKSLIFLDILPHCYKLMNDNYGNYVIQTFLELGTPEQIQILENEIGNKALQLSLQKYGSRVIRRALRTVSKDGQISIARKLEGNVIECVVDRHGCDVVRTCVELIPIQHLDFVIEALKGNVYYLSTHICGRHIIIQILERCKPEKTAFIFDELRPYVNELVKDQYGCFVVQKCVETVPTEQLDSILDALKDNVYYLSTHIYGSHVIRRILERYSPEQTAPILDELHHYIEELVKDQYGTYVIQHILEHGNTEDKSKILSYLRGRVVQLSMHKFGSYVVRKAVVHATSQERQELINEVLQDCGATSGTSALFQQDPNSDIVTDMDGGNDTDTGEHASNSETGAIYNHKESVLYLMMKDQFANNVIQTMLDVAEKPIRKELIEKIKLYRNKLKNLRKRYN